MAYALDTAAAAERIVAAGITPEAARAIVSEVARVDAGRRDDLATKAELLALEDRQKAELLALESRQKAELLALESRQKAELLAIEDRQKAELLALEIRLVKWGIGVAFGTAGILFAALRFTA